tara:strand:- start:377 stop:595 length:219 start_codon:yes stop_codon:yes gene_type:complete
MTNPGSNVIDDIFERLDIKNRISNNLVYNFGEEWSIDKILEKIKIAVWLYLYYNILVFIWYIIAYSARNILD